MPETFCLNHPGRKAVGFCSRCNQSFCANCLDVEMGAPCCENCRVKKSKDAAKPGVPTKADPFEAFAATGKPPMPTPTPKPPNPEPSAPPPVASTKVDPFEAFAATSKPPMPAPTPKPAMPTPTPAVPKPNASPLNFKNMGGMDDDPLGLFGGPVSAPKLDPPNPKPPMPDLTPSPKPPTLTPPTLSAPPPIKLEAPPLKAPTLNPSVPSPLDLDKMIHDPQPPRPPFPPAHGADHPAGEVSHSPLNPVGIPAAPKASKFHHYYIQAKIWSKYLLRRSFEIFDPYAKKMKIPTYALLAIVALLIIGAIVGVTTLVNQKPVSLVDSIPPVHIILVGANQIGEMDITTYTDIQGHLQTLGFSPIIQMTVPQLPSPNFLDIGMKSDVGTYSEVLKTPGQITPHLSFVTIFTNGVWVSTNAWQGTNQDLDFLMSEFYPNDTPDQLYIKHVQKVQKLEQEKDWEVTTMGENRFMALFSDHVRWFLVKKGLQGYQADFALWN
jgi:hypothetical protein